MNIKEYVQEIQEMSEGGIAPTTRQWDAERPDHLLSSTSIITKTGIPWRTFVKEECNLKPSRYGPKRNAKLEYPVCDCGRKATHSESVTVGAGNTETLELCDGCYAEFIEVESSYGPRQDPGARNWLTS